MAFSRAFIIRRKKRNCIIFACLILLCFGLGVLYFLPKSEDMLEEDITVVVQLNDRLPELGFKKKEGKIEKPDDNVDVRNDEYGVDKSLDENLEELEREEKDVELKIGHHLNPKLNDEQHRKIAEEIRQEKEKFIIEQKKQEEEIKRQERDRLLAMTAPAHHGVVTGGEPKDPEVLRKRDFIRQMMKTAWDGYVKHALGHNELRPISKTGHSAGIFGNSMMGATAVDALDTLYIMGLNDEYKAARDWVVSDLNFDVSTTVSLFEMNIRFIGGLLSAYALTKDEPFKIKAKQLADKLLPAFNTGTGIPFALVNLKTGFSNNYAWASGGNSILSEFGSLHLEWTYLSKVTGDPLYADKVNKIRQLMHTVQKPNGLYPNYINHQNGLWGQQSVSLGALGDSFYEYLLKSWLMTGKTDNMARKMYDEAMQAIEKHLITKSSGGLLYVGVYNYGMLEKKMEHLACFSGGMFALGSKGAPPGTESRYMELGEELTRTCRQSYVATATGIGPESFRFDPPHEAIATRAGERYYILRPEVVESYFVLWRLTHDEKYRDWGWEAAQNIERHCRTGVGYSGIHDVTVLPVHHDDVQQSFFLAETLKYLYLLFSDDELLSLDEWVFNTEAHPLPIGSTFVR